MLWRTLSFFRRLDQEAFPTLLGRRRLLRGQTGESGSEVAPSGGQKGDVEERASRQSYGLHLLI